MPAREVVRRVDDGVDALQKLACARWERAPEVHFDRHFRATPREGSPGSFRLARTDVGVLEQKLSVQVLHLDRVFVRDPERAEPRFGERHRRGGPHAAGTDKQDAARGERSVRRSIHRG